MTASPPAPEPKTDEKSAATEAAAPAKKKRQQDGLREISESFVVAFVLAFLFRAFEAEAFVIPTGSMAPTLFGRHKEATCSACGFQFAFGASDEMDEEAATYDRFKRITDAICPNCRFSNPVKDLPAFKGDRIIVNKFPYEFRDPERWDVPVFKYPERPTTNYIKRLVGLPNETLIIRRGDVYRQEADRSLTILRKPPYKQRGLQIPVYDNNYPEVPLHAAGWPKRWAAVEKLAGPSPVPADRLAVGSVAGWTEATTGWAEEAATHSFAISAEKSKGSDLKWLRYRHIIPSAADWKLAKDGPVPARDADFFSNDSLPPGPRPQLITDFCGYNTYVGGNGTLNDDYYWVGDLTLVCEAEVTSVGDGAELVLELNEGARCFRVRFDVATGRAKLISLLRLQPGEPEEDVLAEASCGVRGPGSYELRFANVDDRLCIWVDGAMIDFGDKAEYRVDDAVPPGPRDEDLTPIGVAAKSLSVRVSNLMIQRDIYYRANQLERGAPERFHFADEKEHPHEDGLRPSLKQPNEWAANYMQGARDAKFELGPDEFLMLGDNSPRSQDSRVWPNSRGAEHRHAVPRSALVGRAFFVYWPHGVPFGNDGQGFPVTYIKSRDGDEKMPDLRFPFYPNVPRMRRIH